jgi:hypothetical protein
MASTTAKSGGGSVVNDGGSVVGAGNVPAGSPVTKVIGLNQLNTGSEYGSEVLVDTATGANFTDPHGVIKAKSAGTFAYSPAQGSNFLIRAAGDTNAGKINGSSSTVLSVPGGVTNKSIHKLVKTVQYGTYATTEFNVLALPSSGVVPGRTKGTNAGTAVNYVQADDGSSTASDDAASPTRSVPGELTYMFGAIVPKLDDYKAKNSYES